MIIKPRIAVIGAGNWGKNHVRVFYQLGVLKAVAEENEILRENVRQQYPDSLVYNNHQDVINNPDIDAVVIATPSSTHYQIIKDALLSDKDVLVEKPMTLTVQEAETILSIAENRKLLLMVGHLLLYKPAIQKIGEVINDGQIGDIRYIEMRRLKLGKVRNEENVMWSFSPHDIAVLHYLVKSPIAKVSSYGFAVIQNRVEDDVQIHMELENGVRAYIHASWFWPEDERRTVIIGTKGMITYNEHEDKVWLHCKGINTDLSVWDLGRKEIVFMPIDALEAEASHFLQCIGNRNVPLTDGRMGFNVVKVLEQAENNIKKNQNEKNYFVHETVCMDNPVKIGRGTQIWHFAHVMSGVEIGEGCKFGQNVFISKNVKIGNNVKVQNNVSLYEGVVLEDDVFCGPSMVFTNIKNPRSAFPRNSSDNYLITLVKQGASIGANSTIVCGVTIGKYAFIGAGAVVTRDVPDYAVVYGNPAQIQGWTCRCGSVTVEKEEHQLICGICNTNLDRQK